MCYTVFYVFVFRRFTQNCERRLLASLRLSARPCVRLFVCLRETAQLLLKWFPWNLIFIFFENAPKQLQLIYIWQTVTATLYEDLWTFVIISGSGVLRMRNISEQICRGNKKKPCLILSNSFSESRAVDEALWKSMLESDRPQMMIYHGACALHAG